MKHIILFILLISFIGKINSFSQKKATTFQNAAARGFSYQHLDSLYKSAVNSNPNLAVFKSKEEQISLQEAYAKLIHELGLFLKSKNFRWEKQTRCFNRIYMNPQGGIDYFLYNFPKDELSAKKEKEFDRLLNQFIKKNKIAITAKENFAQCSPIKYSDI